jgi:hypothetical protein
VDAVLTGRKTFFTVALLCAVFGAPLSAEASQSESSDKIISPVHGQVRLDFFPAERRIEERQRHGGHSYVWSVQNGATGRMLQGADGAHCARYRQFVRATPQRVTFGWSDRKGDLVGLRWVARACLDGAKRCALHIVKG